MQQCIFIELQHTIFIQQGYSFNSNARYLTCKKNICSTSITKVMFCEYIYLMSTQIIFIQVQQKIFIHPFASFWISVNSSTIPCHSYFFNNKCYNLHCCRTLWLVWLHKCCNILYYCTSNSRCFQIEQN